MFSSYSNNLTISNHVHPLLLFPMCFSHLRQIMSSPTEIVVDGVSHWDDSELKSPLHPALCQKEIHTRHPPAQFTPASPRLPSSARMRDRTPSLRPPEACPAAQARTSGLMPPLPPHSPVSPVPTLLMSENVVVVLRISFGAPDILGMVVHSPPYTAVPPLGHVARTLFLTTALSLVWNLLRAGFLVFSLRLRAGGKNPAMRFWLAD